MKQTALDKKDALDLQKYESVIERGQKNFIEVGQALFVIKQRKLYRAAFDTFEEYCQERWGWGASRARQICGAVKFWQDNKDKEPPKTERSARRQIQDAKKTELDNEEDTEKSVTGGNALLDAPNIRNGAPKPAEVRKDKVGRPIPEGILADWDRAHEIGTKLRSMVSEVKCTLQKGLEAERESDKDIVFRELGNSVISEAEALHYSLSQIVPYAVCPSCQGKTNRTCQMCRQRGFVSKFYWDSPTVGNDLRNVIRKQYANSQALSA